MHYISKLLAGSKTAPAKDPLHTHSFYFYLCSSLNSYQNKGSHLLCLTLYPKKRHPDSCCALMTSHYLGCFASCKHGMFGWHMLDAGRHPTWAPLYYLTLDNVVKHSAVISGFKISSRCIAGSAIDPSICLLLITAVLAPVQTFNENLRGELSACIMQDWCS